MKYLIIFGLLLFSLESFSQEGAEPPYWTNTKEIGFNVTPLVSSLVPFNIAPANEELVSIIYKKYYKKRAFKAFLGANIDESSNRVNFFHVSIGYEKRHSISEKWFYTSGFRGILELTDTDNGFGGAGFGLDYGLEYHITESMFVSTGTSLLLLFGETAKVTLLPPLSLFFNVRLPLRKNRK